MKPVALITGGNSGLGKASAELLRAQNYAIAILDLNLPASQTEDTLFIPCDVTEASSVENAIAHISKTLGDIRVCVNCAGIAHGERIVGLDSPMPLDHFQKVIDINLIGTFNVLRCASFAMRNLKVLNQDGERGVIINTASIAAFEGQFGQVAYSASKGGVESMTLPAARELADYGIRVVTIAPGLFQTPMMAHIPESAQMELERITLFPKRLGHASEYAQCVLNIIQNPMYNGCTIRLDGGVRLDRGK